MQIQRSDVENNNRYSLFTNSIFRVCFLFFFYSADIIDSFLVYYFSIKRNDSTSSH